MNMRIDASLNPTGSGKESPVSSGYLGALSRRGFALLRGPQGQTFAVSWITHNPPDHPEPPWLETSRPSILFALGIECLWLAFLAIAERATIVRRIRLRRLQKHYRRL